VGRPRGAQAFGRPLAGREVVGAHRAGRLGRSDDPPELGQVAERGTPQQGYTATLQGTTRQAVTSPFAT
jgi:hypothetical protein